MKNTSIKLEGFEKAKGQLSPFFYRDKAAKLLNRRLDVAMKRSPQFVRGIWAIREPITPLLHGTKASTERLQATLVVRYKPVSLVKYDHKRTATGGWFKGVFETYVVTEKRKGWQLVRGKRGFGGFWQPSKGAIYERKQMATWIRGKRAPYRVLYGAAVAELYRDKRVQRFIQGIR